MAAVLHVKYTLTLPSAWRSMVVAIMLNKYNWCAYKT